MGFNSGFKGLTTGLAYMLNHKMNLLYKVRDCILNTTSTIQHMY